MTNLTLASRNIWRNPRRTVLTAFAVAFSTAVVVFFMSLQLSSYEASINATVSVYQGHLQVQRKGYLDRPQVELTIEDVDSLASSVRNIEGVAAATVRGMGFSLVSSSSRSYGVQVIGVDPDREPEISTIPGLVAKGEYFSSSSVYEAVVGEKLAKNLKVKVGDEVTLLGQGNEGNLVSLVVTIRGIFESGSRDLDRLILHLPLKTFQEEFYLGDAAHSIVIKATRLHEVNDIQQRLQSLLAKHGRTQSVALRWDQVTPGLKEAIELDMVGGWIFFFLLILVVSFSVLNTFLMSVLERTKEFGLLLALGVRPARLVIVVLLECILLTLIGLTFGLIVGSLAVWYYGTVGFSIPGTEAMLEVWNLPSKLYPQLSLLSLVGGPLVLFVISFLAGLVPAYRVSRLEAVEAMSSV